MVENIEFFGNDYNLEGVLSIKQIFEINERAGPNGEIDFGKDYYQTSLKDVIYEQDNVSGKDKLKFAKSILAVLAIFMLIIVIIYTCYPTEQTKVIWTFVANFTNTLASLIIGFYFASKR